MAAIALLAKGEGEGGAFGGFGGGGLRSGFVFGVEGFMVVLGLHDWVCTSLVLFCCNVAVIDK